MSNIGQRSILRSQLKNLSKQLDNLAKSELLNEQMIQLNELIQTIHRDLVKINNAPQSKENAEAQAQQAEIIKKHLDFAHSLLMMLTNQPPDNLRDLLVIVGFLVDEAREMMSALSKHLLDEYLAIYHPVA